MTGNHLEAILKQASAKLDKDGFLALPDGAVLTLYVAHDGASLTISKVESLRIDGELVYARTAKRETFTLVQSDVFALAVEGAQGQPARRTAGFG
ncbi:hypothetical protein [Pendulispora albinea]|uniref:Uncharacterized protein n=1 Tax=Pendulispora albinea TaxID=2741071 RepID=A0ABZ2LLV1_9BACT